MYVRSFSCLHTIMELSCEFTPTSLSCLSPGRISWRTLVSLSVLLLIVYNVSVNVNSVKRDMLLKFKQESDFIKRDSVSSASNDIIEREHQSYSNNVEFPNDNNDRPSGENRKSEKAAKLLTNEEPQHYEVLQMLTENAKRMRELRTNCASAIAGTATKSDIALDVGKVMNNIRADRLEYSNMMVKTLLSKNCTRMAKTFGFVTHHLTEEEKNFPIAFSILHYSDFEVLMRLLPAIYRPQNFYCVHLDTKSPDMYKRALKDLRACFPNIVVPETHYSVYWGDFSILQAENQRKYI